MFLGNYVKFPIERFLFYVRARCYKYIFISEKERVYTISTVCISKFNLPFYFIPIMLFQQEMK